MQYLGMSKPSSTKRGFLRRLLRDVEEHGEQKLELAGYDKLLGDPDYHELKQLTSLDVHEMLKRYMSKLHHQLDEIPAGMPHRVPWRMQVPHLLHLAPTASSAQSMHLLMLYSQKHSTREPMLYVLHALARLAVLQWLAPKHFSVTIEGLHEDNGAEACHAPDVDYPGCS